MCDGAMLPFGTFTFYTLHFHTFALSRLYVYTSARSHFYTFTFSHFYTLHSTLLHFHTFTLLHFHTVTPCTTKCTIDFTVFLLCAKILKLLVVLSRKNSKAGLLKMSKMKMKTIFENVENFIGIVLEY